MHELASPIAPRIKRPARARRRFRSKRLLTVLALIAIVLIALREALPHAIKSYVNRQLARSPDYAGSVGDVDVHLWRGAYQIHDVKIEKTDGEVPVPLFAAKKLDLSIQWKELFHGALVGEVVLDEPEIHFVTAPSPEQAQSGRDGHWGNTLESLFPFKINRLEILRGKVHFQNFHSQPQVNIFVSEVSAIATNLTNTRNLTQPLPAGVFARGKASGGGDLDLQIHLNPLAARPTFELIAQVTNVNLIALNDFFKVYGKFDVERGRFALYGSFAVADGKYDGYAKVFFEDLDVFAWEKERKKNILQVFWQAIVGTMSTVFRNQPKDRLAAKIPISGSYEGTDIGTWTAVRTLLRNAFVRALVPKLDRTITVEEVQKEKP